VVKDFGIRGFIPVSMLDWPGKITAVVFLAGCNFRCPFCHNHGLVLSPFRYPLIAVEDVLNSVTGRAAWVDGITGTGGEPTLNADLPALLRVFRDAGVAIKLDTNGSNPAMLEDLLAERLLDAVAMDVKAPLVEDDYSAMAGTRVNPRVIETSISILKHSGIDVTFRTTVVPRLVEEREVAAIRLALGDVPRYVIQPFRNVDTLDRDLMQFDEFEPERIEAMRMQFEVPAPLAYGRPVPDAAQAGGA